ncbi:MAG: hypothetical protein JWQ49_3300 [Edaphobacter sp.]|nr:hypothetical protein [Edaphobacter sp.]
MIQADQKKIVLLVDDAPANIQIVNSILKDIYKNPHCNQRCESIGTGESCTSA